MSDKNEVHKLSELEGDENVKITIHGESDIAPVPLGRELTPSSLDMAEKIGQIAFNSGTTGLSRSEAAIFKVLTGYELGFPMMASLKIIHAITAGGKTTMALAPKAMLALIYNSGLVEDFEIIDLIDDAGNVVGCTVTGKRKDNWSGDAYEATFTLEDAQRAKLVKPGGAWEMYPGNMCRWRAIGFWCDVVVPDLTLGLMRTTDLTDQVDAEGIPEVTVIDVGMNKKEPVKTGIQLSDLMNEYSPAEILNANDGVMPDPTGDMEALAKKLKKE